MISWLIEGWLKNELGKIQMDRRTEYVSEFSALGVKMILHILRFSNEYHLNFLWNLYHEG